MGHPLVRLLREAALGRPPAPDGTLDVMPSPPGRVDAVVGFTAHHVVAASVAPTEVHGELDLDGGDDLGAPLKPRFLTWLGRRLHSEPGSLDVVLAATGTGDGPALLRRRADLDAHPRVARSRRYRYGSRVYTDADVSGVVIVGRGLAGRWEVSLELDVDRRGRGLGRALVADARDLVPKGEPLFAQVAPGNAASLRAFLAADFRPVGAEVLFVKTPGPVR